MVFDSENFNYTFKSPHEVYGLLPDNTLDEFRLQALTVDMSISGVLNAVRNSFEGSVLLPFVSHIF
jgi:hypothetical protein